MIAFLLADVVEEKSGISAGTVVILVFVLVVVVAGAGYLSWVIKNRRNG